MDDARRRELIEATLAALQHTARREEPMSDKLPSEVGQARSPYRRRCPRPPLGPTGMRSSFVGSLRPKGGRGGTAGKSTVRCTS
jgi:hypothetical protein